MITGSTATLISAPTHLLIHRYVRYDSLHHLTSNMPLQEIGGITLRLNVTFDALRESGERVDVCVDALERAILVNLSSICSISASDHWLKECVLTLRNLSMSSGLVSGVTRSRTFS